MDPATYLRFRVQSFAYFEGLDPVFKLKDHNLLCCRVFGATGGLDGVGL